MPRKYVGKFRYPGVTRGKPVAIDYASKEARERSLKTSKKLGATIVYPKRF
jgi:hypothetical protein